jgi:hypothetical protein
MFHVPRRRVSLRQIYVAGLLLLSLLLWLIFRGGDERGRHYRSPYALASQHLDDTLPIVDVTIRECTRWRWFESRSECMNLLKNGWEISGGDLLLDTGKHRLHLFIKRDVQQAGSSGVITDIRISRERPDEDEAWEAREGGIWLTRKIINNIKQAVTAIDFIHGKGLRELRRGRQFARGGQLLMGQDINLSFRVGLPPPREFPRLKVNQAKPYKVLQVAGTVLSKLRSLTC